MINIKAVEIATGSIALLMIGIWIGYQWNKPKMITVQTQPQVIQADNSIQVAVNPVKQLTPKMLIPKGDKVLSTGTLLLSPEAPNLTNGQNPKDKGKAPNSLQPIPKTPIDLDFSIVKEDNGIDRLIVKDPTNTYQISGSEEVLEQQAVIQEPGKYTLQALYGYDVNSHKQVYGALYQYQPIKHIAVGTGFIGQTAFVSLGVQW